MKADVRVYNMYIIYRSVCVMPEKYLKYPAHRWPREDLTVKNEYA